MIVVEGEQYFQFQYNACGTKGEGGGKITTTAYNAIVKIIYNP